MTAIEKLEEYHGRKYTDQGRQDVARVLARYANVDIEKGLEAIRLKRNPQAPLPSPNECLDAVRTAQLERQRREFSTSERGARDRVFRGNVAGMKRPDLAAAAFGLVSRMRTKTLQRGGHRAVLVERGDLTAAEIADEMEKLDGQYPGLGWAAKAKELRAWAETGKGEQ